MSADDWAQFLARHEQQKDKILHNKEELLAYCIDDVSVLRQACCAFRNLFLKLLDRPFQTGFNNNVYL